MFVLFIIICSGFFNSIISEKAGGWTGLEINNLLVPFFSKGLNILYFSLIIIIFSFLTQVSIFAILKNIGISIYLIFAKIFIATKIVFLKIRAIFLYIKHKLIHKPRTVVSSRPVNNIFSRTKKPISKKPTNVKSIQSINFTDCVLPHSSLLDATPTNNIIYSNDELNDMSNRLVEKLGDFGISVEVTAITPGPVITSFEISLPAGIKASKVVGLDKDLARALLVESVRVIDVIPGKPVIGLEIPNSHRQMISLSEIINSPTYQNSKTPLTMCLGKGVTGNEIIMDLAKTPHLLVAGATGMGKSVGLNAMLMGILYKSNPKDVRIIMIDPKVVELAIYADIPHLLTPVVTDMNQAASSLFWSVQEMERRYLLLAKFGVRNIEGFNEKLLQAKKTDNPLLDPNFDEASAGEGEVAPELEKLPLIVIVIDEYADMLGALAQEDRTKSKRTESFIIRLAQKARAAGIHLIIATQRPSVDVITGLIKSNVPSRIAFKVSSKIDSRTILDRSGAEQLLGLGDMLYMMPGKSYLTRVHGAFVSDAEIVRVVSFLKENYSTNYVEGILNQVQDTTESDETNRKDTTGELDPLYDEAVEFVTSSGKVSISSVQRRLRVGYNRAARIVEDMEVAGVVSSMNSGGSRQVLAPPPV